MLPRADSLFHFTRSLESLKGILGHGFQPRYSLEDASLLGLDYLGFPMVCFCDIPMSRISEHTAFYGEYGLGMTKEWGKRSGLHPLLYAADGGALPKIANSILEMGEPTDDNESEIGKLKSTLRTHFFDLAPMIKPLSGKMIVGGSVIDKDFSQENEWRFVPAHSGVLFRNNFEEKKIEQNSKVIKDVLRFTPGDIRYIFVKHDGDIPPIFDFIQTNLGLFPMNDIKVMISRIVSLETIARDL